MSDLFICYSRTDKAIAGQLAELLKAEGWSVFMDVHTHVGKRYDEVIETELDAARAVVVLWSTASRKTQNIRERLGGSASMLEPFPNKPERMHRSTCWRLRMNAEEAYQQSLGYMVSRFGGDAFR